MGALKLTYQSYQDFLENEQEKAPNLKVVPNHEPTSNPDKNYYAFGSLMPGRNVSSGDYRFGFIGMENDDEVNGQTGGSQDHLFRSYDPRLGRYKSLDPLARKFAWNSPYAYAENRVIDGLDLEGQEYFDSKLLNLMISKGEEKLANGGGEKVERAVYFLKVVRGMHSTTAQGTAEGVIDFVTQVYNDLSAIQDGINAGTMSESQAMAIVNSYASSMRGHAEGKMVQAIITSLWEGRFNSQANPDAVGESIGIIFNLAFGIKASKGKITKTAPKVVESGNYGKYAPQRPLPKSNSGTPVPDAEATGSHTQLGTKNGRKGNYTQAREFDADGNPVRDVDFTDHGRPADHTNPHQHDYIPNKTGGTPSRGKAKPIDKK